MLKHQKYRAPPIPTPGLCHRPGVGISQARSRYWVGIWRVYETDLCRRTCVKRLIINKWQGRKKGLSEDKMLFLKEFHKLAKND